MIWRNRFVAICVAVALSWSAGAYAAKSPEEQIKDLKYENAVMIGAVQNARYRADRLDLEIALLREKNRQLKAEVAELKGGTAEAGESGTSPTPLLTDAEFQQIAAFLAQRDAQLAARGFSGSGLKSFRSPLLIETEYERYKYDHEKRRWTEKPVLPQEGPWYHWHLDAKNYQRQLFCDKCKGTKSPDGKRTLDGWANPSGFTCQWQHPIDTHDQWMFLCNYLIACDKDIEAKAWLWTAKEHGDITEEFWSQIMNEAWAQN